MTIEQYLALPYTITLRVDEDGDTVAKVQELPGCSAHGKTAAEALENVHEAERLWIEDALESGDAIPTPEADNEVLPSGKWVQRAPRSLHKKLIQYAKTENVSLNQAVNSILSEAMGTMAERAVFLGGHVPISTSVSPYRNVSCDQSGHALFSPESPGYVKGIIPERTHEVREGK